MNTYILNRRTSGLTSANTEYCLRHLEMIMVYLKHRKNSKQYYILNTLRNLPDDGAHLPPAFEYKLRKRGKRGSSHG